jgi:hypothetical protein
MPTQDQKDAIIAARLSDVRRFQSILENAERDMRAAVEHYAMARVTLALACERLERAKETND